MKIPCDTIARLSHLLPEEPSDDPMHAFRLENGKIMTTDRSFMAVEEVERFEGVFYIRNDPALIEQCRTEAQWSATIEFTPVPAINYTTAITSFGWSVAENIGLWPTEPTDWDKWRDVILSPCLEPLSESQGPMTFVADSLHRLALTSPSGGIVLEQYADPIRRPTVVRDIDTNTWVGFFRARVDDGRQHVSATVPGWLR